LMSINVFSLHHYGDIQKHLVLKNNIEKSKLVKLMDVQYCLLSFPIFSVNYGVIFASISVFHVKSPVDTINLIDNIYKAR
jgi:hypothetical protein